MNFVSLLRRNPRTLGFGFLHALASSAGQTFVIALFLPDIKGSFGLGDAEVASLYAAATVASAAVLWTAGRWIDRVDLLRYSFMSGLFLALACFFTASVTLVPLLAIGFFALRLGGQGLLTHVTVTAVARYFSKDRG
ncbi:MAG: MFS transporter, partial [Burkholderiaceae bacterium]|nr:MFS transporter [Burkholderiaceae bacterium]